MRKGMWTKKVSWDGVLTLIDLDMVTGKLLGQTLTLLESVLPPEQAGAAKRIAKDNFYALYEFNVTSGDWKNHQKVMIEQIDGYCKNVKDAQREIVDDPEELKTLERRNAVRKFEEELFREHPEYFTPEELELLKKQYN
jgi:hypothetical protein